MLKPQIIHPPKRKSLERGVYYAPLFFAKITKNTGFICQDGFFSDSKLSAMQLGKLVNQAIKAHWNLAYTGKTIKLVIPQDENKYPLFRIEQGDNVLPIALISGPMYAQEMAKKLAQDKQENNENLRS